MSNRIEIDGKFYRKRRGQLVEIPPEWVGQVTHPQTMRKRPSKTIHKQARDMKGRRCTIGHPHDVPA
jgi:hypothetical protein